MDPSEMEYWQPVLTRPVLLPGQVHLWRVELGGSGNEDGLAWSVLSAEERARAERFHFDLHRGRFVRAHGFVRGILALYTGLPAAQMQFRAGQAGKPELSGWHRAGGRLRFNLSHSADLMVLAVGQGELGVDVEVISETINWREIAMGTFTPGEITAISNSPTSRAALKKFYRAWTMKEAYLKAQGDGLAKFLKEVEVDLSDSAEPRFLRLPGGENEKQRWQVKEFQPASAAVGAIVVESDGDHRPELLRFRAENLTDLPD